jgi:hypothetical protein
MCRSAIHSNHGTLTVTHLIDLELSGNYMHHTPLGPQQQPFISLKNLNRLVFIIDTQRVFCEVETALVYDINIMFTL